MEASGIEQRAGFEIIRYSNCWEDTGILLDALDIKAGSKCLSVASAGDNSLGMLVKEPEVIIAFDISKIQLALVELKIASFKNLDYKDMLGFLGFIRSEDSRLKIYYDIKKDLSEQAKQLLDDNKKLIETGIIHTGKFEKYFQAFHNKVLPLVHSKKTVQKLLEEKTEDKRLQFYNSKWDNFRWQLMFKIFFSRFVMGRLGRDPEFFKYVEGDVSSRILERTKYAFTILPTNNNPYLKYVMTGEYNSTLPFYVREENFETIKKNFDKLELFYGTSEELFKHYNMKFDCFNLSDIFEYMSVEKFKNAAGQILNYSKQGARLAYWNMLVDRRISEFFPDRLKYLDEMSKTLFNKDKAFFYKAFIVEEGF